MRQRVLLATLTALLFSTAIRAADTGNIRGVVHDPQHRPIAGATIVVRARSSTWSQTTQSDSQGEFHFADVPLASYTVNISAPGFNAQEQTISVVAGKSPVLHFPLEIAGSRQQVQVTEQESKLKTQSSTLQTLVSTQEISHTAGADQTNSMAMITDFTPGAYMVHDMLHMRGGHQVNWFIDGIPVINTNIAVNVAPLINPKNVESLEIERGGYSSEYGDRTYGVFNVVSPSGFEHNQQAEIDGVVRQFPHHRRSVELWQPHGALRLLRQRGCQPFGPWSHHADFRRHPRSGRRSGRIHVAAL